MTHASTLTQAVLLSILSTTLFFLTVPMRCVHDNQLQQAVDHGAAVWEVDQKTGKTTFKWKEPKP